MSTTLMTAPSHARINPERWPGEKSLFAVSVAISLILWIVFAVTIIGLVYALLVGLFLVVVQAAFVAQIRGSAVRLGPQQMPELFERVEHLAGRMGMQTTPTAYVMQAGGSLNAFATRFLGGNYIVLYSELLEACGENTAARDMIIGHELGHIHAGHLRLRWLIAPSAVVPFLSSALSRAREYTCDRFGAAAAGDPEGAKAGLTILAAGGKLARRVDIDSFTAQRNDLDGFWMEVGQLLATHPPLCKRIDALENGGPRY